MAQISDRQLADKIVKVLEMHEPLTAHQIEKGLWFIDRGTPGADYIRIERILRTMVDLSLVDMLEERTGKKGNRYGLWKLTGITPDPAALDDLFDDAKPTRAKPKRAACNGLDTELLTAILAELRAIRQHLESQP